MSLHAAFNLGKYYKTVPAPHAVSAPDLSDQLELLQGLANVSTELAMKYSDLKGAVTEALGFSWWKNEPELYASNRTWNGHTTNENSIVDTGTIRSMRTSHCKWNSISSTSESKKLAQSIRRAKGLFDRALDEMVDFREMHEFHTPSGRCWHVTPECPTLANSEDR